MAIEVELKARIDNPDEMRERLHRTARFVHSFEKQDIYFTRPGEAEGLFRIRNEDGSNTVTYKRKTIEEGIEVNQEHEFIVSDATEFLGFCEYLGYIKYIEKHKTGDLFSYRKASLELTFVESLGWFVEIEYLVDEDSEVDAARKRLHDILSDLNISKERIEARYYTDMLREQKRG